MTFVRGVKDGNVPTARVAPIIAELIEERWPESRRGPDEAGGKEILAEKIGCAEDTIDSLVRQAYEGVSFDLADRIFCALGRPDLWIGVLADIYPTKFRETCANPMCNKKFPERGGGARRRLYCGRKCRQLHHLIKQGKATGMKAAGRCHKGHRLSPDNIIKRPDGKRECRECSIAGRRHRYASDPGYRARAAESRRRWAAKRAA